MSSPSSIAAEIAALRKEKHLLELENALFREVFAHHEAHQAREAEAQVRRDAGTDPRQRKKKS